MLRRSVRHTALAVVISLPTSACVSAFRPAEVPVPASCEALLQRAGQQGSAGLSESDARQVVFCQQQRILRAEETQAQFAHYQARTLRTAGLFSAVSALATVLAFILR